MRACIQVGATKGGVKRTSPIDAADEEEDNYDGNYRVWSAETSDNEGSESEQRRRQSDEQSLKERDGTTLPEVAEDLGNSDEDNYDGNYRVWSVEGSDEEGHGPDHEPICAPTCAKDACLNTGPNAAPIAAAAPQSGPIPTPGVRNSYLLSDCRSCKSVLVKCYRVDELD
jgi:hypothetical protein